MKHLKTFESSNKIVMERSDVVIIMNIAEHLFEDWGLDRDDIGICNDVEGEYPNDFNYVISNMKEEDLIIRGLSGSTNFDWVHAKQIQLNWLFH